MRAAPLPEQEASHGHCSVPDHVLSGRLGVEHDGSTKGPCETSEAAFEATVMAASNALRAGLAVEISAPGRQPERRAAT
jgi:hypothetical protein